ncbi:MAG: transglycosylase SLT domain-containing protein [Candidatus Thiodiazotropha sp. (ex Epidulcina cf. delphinae)]|nr:transglycosylase SLT domain-containing protein [Candidatus Thiodiazotropha sp. (ex Epidulcina cf. delphinae)]
MSPFPLIPLLAFMLFSSAATSIAASGDSHDDRRLQIQRQRFLAAETALDANDMTAYLQLREALQDYPLLPYLDYRETLATLEQQSLQSMSNRLMRLEGTPLKRNLRRHWLALMAKEELWHTYLKFSREGGGIEQRCNRLHAMIAIGEEEAAFKSVKPIWLSGRSRPRACDPVFNAWIAAGRLDEQLVWQRIDLAMSKGRTRLARYLKRHLSQRERSVVELWLELYRHPEKVGTLLAKSHPMRDEMAVQAIRSLAWRDLETAFTAWEQFHHLAIFSDRQQLRAGRALAGRLARQPNKRLSQRLAHLLPDHLRLDTRLSERQLQAALRESDWQWVLQTVETLPSEERQQEQWRYWRSRALIQLGRTIEGEEILQPLSQERSYYGFLAAQRLGDHPKLSHVSLRTDQGVLEKLAKLPGLLRARELHILDRPLPARREWNLALKSMGEDELRAAARLAQQWNWPSQGILTLTRLRQWNDLELRFPLAHREAITGQARDLGIDSAWIYAILRQESAFMSDAKSYAGARGLMQLMPKTAKQLAKELKQTPLKPEDLFQPEVNIKLGSGYLNKIYRQLQENPVLATAAYNAGPGRVKSWLPEQPLASDVWIETVPFRETREYLKRVLAYTVIYSYRLGDVPITLPLPWLRPIEAIKSKQGKRADLASGV